MPVVGPYYTKEEIEHAWIAEGGSQSRADVGSAIALAESSGGAGSWSPNPVSGLTNWGVFQLARKAAGALLTLRGNVREAIVQSKDGTDWCDWQTWDGRGCKPGNYTGTYRQYLRGAPPPLEPGTIVSPVVPVLPDSRPLPEPRNQGERQWDYSPIVYAAARSHADAGRQVGAAALGVLARLKRWRLPR